MDDDIAALLGSDNEQFEKEKNFVPTSTYSPKDRKSRKDKKKKKESKKSKKEKQKEQPPPPARKSLVGRHTNALDMDDDLFGSVGLNIKGKKQDALKPPNAEKPGISMDASDDWDAESDDIQASASSAGLRNSAESPASSERARVSAADSLPQSPKSRRQAFKVEFCFLFADNLCLPEPSFLAWLPPHCIFF